MSWLRTAGLILLTLIATTLPSSALTVQQRGPREKNPAKATVTQAPASPDESSTDRSPKPPTLKIAPNTELWDGSGLRALSMGTGLAAACVTGHPGGPNLAPEIRPSFPHVVDVETLRSSQRAWLSSHYPHAPPA